jgi:protein SCO1/2
MAVLCVTLACAPAPEPRQYELVGQVLGVDRAKQEILIRHQDIPGFMPGMTMPFKVRDEDLLEGPEAGDLVTATLVVEEVDAYLSAITRTGHAPLDSPAGGPAISAGDLLEPGDIVDDTGLVDQDGAARPLTQLEGHRVAVTFIYTRCPLPDFCPLMDRHFLEVQRQLASRPELADVRLVSVTLDPEFDTPEVLRAHAARLGADPRRWRFVTGEPDAVAAFARTLGVTAEADAGDPAALVHNLRTAVLDAEGRLVTATSGNQWTPADLVADLTAAPAPTH